LIAATIYAGGIVGVMTVGNELIMGAVPPERAGAAATVVETATEFGAALGIAPRPSSLIVSSGPDRRCALRRPARLCAAVSGSACEWFRYLSKF
jgi:hypothetical protein